MLAHTLSLQITRLSLLSVGIVLAVATGLVWWAAEQIDGRALQRQQSSLSIGLADVAERMPVEQDTSAVWDDAVAKVRESDSDWLAENLAEWVSAFFGHELVYLLDPNNDPIRAVVRGERVADIRYELDRRAIQPLALAVRRALEEAGSSTVAPEWRRLGTGTIGLVSVRPIVGDSSAVEQIAGEEYLHVSVRFLSANLLDRIAERHHLDGLTVARNGIVPAGAVTMPVTDAQGNQLALLAWQPYRPALQLLGQMAPTLLVLLLLSALGVALLLNRLRRTTHELERSEAHATYLAFHDALAGIPNRALFEDRLSRALANRRQSGIGLALLAIDIDRFKHVNDTLGHPAGDELIRQVAGRLNALVREVDTVARVGGDEFAILQVDVEHVSDAIRLAQAVVARLAEPFNLFGHEVSIGASVGLAFSDITAEEAEDLQRHADIALYEAKTSGRGRYQLFAGELDESVRERRALELELRAALQGTPGLSLQYQPIYDSQTGAVAGAEALVRWDHPVRGRLAPCMFIPLAEERGLIDALGLWVLRQACTYAVRTTLPWVAVNVSPLQFRDERFADRVAEVLSETGLAPVRLELEITEGLLLQNSSTVQQTLMQLRSTGVRVALDDFGTGYSSISYLRTHGVDKLKIDQSFVAQLASDLEVNEIVRCIIALGNAMHMKVTAEGVETGQQLQTLQQMGCGQLQGYLLSRPLAPDRMQALLERRSPPVGLAGDTTRNAAG